MEKLIITAAITGASTIPSLSPYLPIPPKQIDNSATEAAEAGAAEINLSTIAIHMDRHVGVWIRRQYLYQEGGISKEQRAMIGKGSPVCGNTES